MFDRLASLGLLARAALRGDRRQSVLFLVTAVAVSAANALTGLWFKVIADAAASRHVVAALVAVGLFAMWWGLRLASFAVMAYQRYAVSMAATFELRRMVATTAQSIPTIEHYERADYLDKLALLDDELGNIMDGLLAVVTLVALVVTTATSAILLASVSPLLLCLLVFALPYGYLMRRGNAVVNTAVERSAPHARLGEHLLGLQTTRTAAEARVFGLTAELARRDSELWRRVTAEGLRARGKAGLLEAAAAAMSLAGLLGGVAYVLALALHHRISVGDVLLVVTTVGTVFGQVVGFGQIAAQLMTVLRAVDRYRWLVDYAASASPAVSGSKPVPRALTDGIRLQHVSFQYPGTDRYVLQEVDLDIAPGSVVAVVGDNGAGKTSLVKLLCGFYRPTEGVITIDGTSLAEIAPEEWRSRIACGFQDFCRFELLARECVGVGDLPRIDDVAAVRAALERAAAAEVVAELPRALETQLGVDYTGGVDLSGGQWQRLALGRALMREAPLLMILDEPTASLDASAEHELFDRYARAARKTSAITGGITLVVSHRFSTVRGADIIVVVENGRLTEIGRHEELVNRGGTYAELYELQASGYR